MMNHLKGKLGIKQEYRNYSIILLIQMVRNLCLIYLENFIKYYKFIKDLEKNIKREDKRAD